MAMPRLALSEMLVWAAAFAQKANEFEGDSYENQAAEAVKAGFLAVDLLRVSQELVQRGNSKYADQKIAYNESIERGDPLSKRPKITSKETLPNAQEMLRAFLISDGKP